MDNSRRLKIFKVSEDVVANFIRCSGRGFRVTDSECPEDGKIVGIRHNFETSTFDVRVESASFDEVPEGTRIPVQSRSVTVEDLGAIGETQIDPSAPSTNGSQNGYNSRIGLTAD